MSSSYSIVFWFSLYFFCLYSLLFLSITSCYKFFKLLLPLPVRNLVHFLPIPLVNKMPTGEEVGLEVPVQHVLHHRVHRFISCTYTQKLYNILQITCLDKVILYL